MVKPGGHCVQISLFVLVGSVSYSARGFTLQPSSCACRDLAAVSESQNEEVSGCFCSRIYLIFSFTLLGLGSSLA